MNADGAVGDELVERFRTITGRLQSLKLETDEVSYFYLHDYVTGPLHQTVSCQEVKRQKLNLYNLDHQN